jgi:histidine triad (HIT) family protein
MEGDMADTIFGKIVRGELEAAVVYRDELVTAFRDIRPQAPVHVLIVPNEPVASVAHVEARHEAALGRMFIVARRIAEEEGVAEDGYRLIVNTRDHAGQEVHHLHMHLLAGRPLGPMLTSRRKDEG